MQQKKVKILSVDFDTDSKEIQLKKAMSRLSSGKSTKIFTPNPQILIKTQKDKALKELLSKADITLPDGIGISLASKMLTDFRITRIPGIDFAESILNEAQKEGYSVFLLGGKPGRAERAKENLQKKYPSLNICGSNDGYFQKHGADNERVIEKINNSSADILFVCFGFPEQEKWISENSAHLPSVRLAMGLGGSIDVWSGEVKRAPRWVQKCGLEWIWRVIKEPKRIKIFIDIPLFLHLVSTQKRALRKKAKRP